ncbi:hypothetical protein ACIQWA_03205 [Kitasatospora sp. NPDC098652]|uniref:hypothetical protein n=1 Tax=Kitasatospora sp. NPDC098652 TaxID=3364095 RepID=UPI0037FD5BE3
MATKTSILVRTAAALCAVTAGGFALTAVGTGAHASATAQGDATPVPFASTSPQVPGTPTATASDIPSGQPEPTSAKPAEPDPTAAPPGGGVATPVPASPAPAKPAGPGAAAPAAPAPLAPSKLPDAGGAAWKPIAPPHTQPAVQSVGLNECATVKGAATWQQQGYVSSFKTPAVQDTFTFADPETARRAYEDVLAAMNTCQQQSRDAQSAAKLAPDAVVTTTAAVTGGTAYAREWTAVPGMSAPGPQTGHVYVVQRGGVLAVLQFAVPAATPGDHTLSADADRGALTELATRLETAPAPAPR